MEGNKSRHDEVQLATSAMIQGGIESGRAQLLSIMITWNRQDFLRRTIASLGAVSPPRSYDLVVVDNGSGEETTSILRSEARLAGCHFLGENRGINGAIEFALDRHLSNRQRWILISDADMEYRLPIALPIRLLEARSEIGAVSFQHSPEHPSFDVLEWNGRQWPLKRTERGCSLMFRTETLLRMRPLPIQNLKDFDWWVC